MNVPTISMPKYEARARIEKYLKAQRDGVVFTRSDKAELLMYRRLARGHSILNLWDALRVGGLDDQNRPRLAISRADAAHCFGSTWMSGFIYTRRQNAYAACHGGTVIPPAVWDFSRLHHNWWTLRATVPNIPISIRPRKRLDHYWILFEAAWSDVTRDPILLRRILPGKPLFAVLAAWDLTEVERAALLATRQA